MPNTEGQQAMHRKGTKISERTSGWVEISHPKTKVLDDGFPDEGPPPANIAFDRQGDHQPDNAEPGIPLWKKAYMQVEAAAYKGYRRGVEGAAWASEVGSKVVAAVDGVINGEKVEKDADKGEKLKKD